MNSGRHQELPSLYLEHRSLEHQNADHQGEASPDEMWCIDGRMTIGREAADITIALPELSRLHAEVVNEGSRCSISDLGSKNGTAVNGVMLDSAACHLAHGDSVVLAGAVSLRFHDPNATPVVPRLGKLKGIWFDERTRDVWIDAQRLHPPLSAKQADLLSMVLSADGQIVSRDDMIDCLWPEADRGAVSNDALDSLIKRLRRRLAELENGDSTIEMVRGRGLRMVP